MDSERNYLGERMDDVRPGALIHPSPEDADGSAMVIVWIFVASCVWAGIFGYVVMG